MQMTFACGPGGVLVTTNCVSVGGAGGVLVTTSWVSVNGMGDGEIDMGVVETVQAKMSRDRMTIGKISRFMVSPFNFIIVFFFDIINIERENN